MSDCILNLPIGCAENKLYDNYATDKKSLAIAIVVYLQ